MEIDNVTTPSPLPAHVRILGAQRASLSRQVVASYRAGHSVRRIANDLGRSYGFVHRLLTEDGISMRPRGGNTRAGTQSAPPAARPTDQPTNRAAGRIGTPDQHPTSIDHSTGCRAETPSQGGGQMSRILVALFNFEAGGLRPDGTVCRRPPSAVRVRRRRRGASAHLL